MSATPERAILFKRGGFSGANDHLAAAIRAARPDLALDVVDVEAQLRGDRLLPLARAAGALREYGAGAIRSKARWRYAASRNAVYDERARRAALAAIDGRDYAFSIQTQSLFDASSGRWPHFVYTDHAALARVGGVWDDGRGAPSQAWLDRERRIYARADRVFTFGSSIAALIAARYDLPADRVVRAGAGAAVTPTTPVSTETARYARRNILFVGIDWTRKGGPDLLAAFRLLRRRLPDATLTVVGCAPPDAVGVDGCTVMGRLPPTEVERCFHAASCFCMPSRLEPFGLVFCEALHFALPIVATTVGDTADMVRDGQTGLRTPPADPDALAEALFQVLADPDTAQRMGAAGAALAPDFTWDATARTILAAAPPSHGMRFAS